MIMEKSIYKSLRTKKVYYGIRSILIMELHRYKDDLGRYKKDLKKRVMMPDTVRIRRYDAIRSFKLKKDVLGIISSLTVEVNKRLEEFAW